SWTDGYAVAFGPQGDWFVQASAQHAVLVLRRVGADRVVVMNAGTNPYWLAVHPGGKVMAVTRWSGEEVAILPLDPREATPDEAKKIQSLIANWQSDSFGVREKASRDLTALGLIADPFLAKALTQSP